MATILFILINTTVYRYNKDSGVPQSTIANLCNGKTSIEKCCAGTLYKISKALGVSLDYLIERSQEEKKNVEVHLEYLKAIFVIM